MGQKKYYWLRLKRDFFKRHDIKIIEAMENGTDYILFYLKLLCESVDHEGNLRFSDEIPYDDKMLSVITDTNIDIVRSAIKVFTGLGMMELMDDGTYFMSGIEKLMGSETDEHVREQNRIRQQRYRDKKRLGMNNNICVYCGSDGDTIDHIIPKAVGGSDDASNIVYACLKCNMKKNDLPLDRFLNNKILDGESVDVDGILSNPKLNKYVTFDYFKNRFEPAEALCNDLSRVTRNGEKEIEKEKDINNIYIVEQEDEKDSFSEACDEIIAYLNEKTGKNYKAKTKSTKKCIHARMSEGFTIDDFKAVIDIKTKQWLKDEKMNEYLRPETLFGTKFEGYLNQVPKREQPKAEKPLSELTESEWKELYNEGKVTMEDYYRYHE